MKRIKQGLLNSTYESIEYDKNKKHEPIHIIETMTDEQLKEEQRVLAGERLSSVENELFYRANPECRRH